MRRLRKQCLVCFCKLRSFTVSMKGYITPCRNLGHDTYYMFLWVHRNKSADRAPLFSIFHASFRQQTRLKTGMPRRITCFEIEISVLTLSGKRSVMNTRNLLICSRSFSEASSIHLKQHQGGVVFGWMFLLRGKQTVQRGVEHTTGTKRKPPQHVLMSSNSCCMLRHGNLILLLTYKFSP